MLTLQATSQQACLPALTQGNMKITETITHIRIPPSAVEGQTLLIFLTLPDYTLAWLTFFHTWTIWEKRISIKSNLMLS